MPRFRPTIALVSTCCLLAAAPLTASDSPRFRGPHGDGVFEESGLLTAWPKGGPPLLWAVEGLGDGFASVSVADGRLYTTGMSGRAGSAFAFDLEGENLWKKGYGLEHGGNGYPGTRTIPTVHDGRLYLMSAMGKAICLDAGSGDRIWEVDLLSRFGGEGAQQSLNLRFGMAESPLVVDGRVIYTPGAPGASLVALDPKTGDTVWKAGALSDKSGYCTPRLYENGGTRQIITHLTEHLVGVDPGTGAVRWQHPFPARYGIHAVSPVFADRSIYVSHGYKQGGALLELDESGTSVKQKWTDEKLDIHHGGAVVHDSHVYGAASGKTWYALDIASGEIVASIKGLGKGSVVFADGRLYGYVESGEVVLVDPDPKAFAVVSSFEITRGAGRHWAHPVISDGVLYIRHGDALMAFDVRRGDKSR